MEKTLKRYTLYVCHINKIAMKTSTEIFYISIRARIKQKSNDLRRKYNGNRF